MKGFACGRLLPIALALVCGQALAAEPEPLVLRCNLDHPGGAQERAALSITGGSSIGGFAWTYKTRRGASCDIRADSFRVIGRELLEGRGGCQMMYWRQGAKITLALSPATPACSAYCTTLDAYESLLPVSFDAGGAGCAR